MVELSRLAELPVVELTDAVFFTCKVNNLVESDPWQ